MIAPDPVPPLVSMAERQARAMLLTLAAIHGGTVNAIYSITENEVLGLVLMSGEIPPRVLGSVIRARLALLAWAHSESWVWSRPNCLWGWRSPRSLAPWDVIVPTGRIDRGLGAVCGVALSPK